MPLAIAHRGDPRAWPENTLPAFAAAVDRGADLVELDLRRTRDGAIVVLHDPTLHRLWGVDRRVDELDLADVQALGYHDVRVPTLGQVVDRVAVPLMVDFTGEEVVPGTLALLRGAGAVGRCLFVSGNVDALGVLRAHAPEARIGLTWVRDELPDPALLVRLGATWWNPRSPLATPRRVAALHELGYQVSTWTIDGRLAMARAVRAGVDAIVSNRITRLRRLVDRVPHRT